MKLHLHRLELPLEFEFTIARGSISTQPSLVVELEQQGHRGYGESTANPYYGHTLDSMSQSLQSCRETIESYEFGRPAELWQILQKPLADDSFALSALDLAAYDLFGKLTSRRTYELLDLSWESVPESSYTIGIDTIDKMVAKLKARPNWRIYKVKLGTDRDVEIVRSLRQVTSAVFRVDANCGWTAEETIENSHQLKSLGVEFIEQPLPADASTEDQRLVYQHSALPIIADESCQIESDVGKCAGRFHGVNVKLCKCGGLTPAVRMLRQARQLGLKTMLGCMVESTVGISGAAQLSPLLDYADLDGAELLSADAASGVSINQGRIELGDGYGSGVVFTGNSPY
ncbi:dipeptide epimerase [Stieleria varia]|uniref:Dipeptide epimerase n=1 Tax=Stieleria varia TaxID=2528005 RepID=A0A5C6A5M2_9BACT|nr:dipeptide epimerase [Stieleria varia]TWT94695.1 L-Ala-D/L-Glu epimerase [Stieleria varia]